MQKVPPASQVLSLPETALGGLGGMPSVIVSADSSITSVVLARNSIRRVGGHAFWNVINM